MRMHWVLPLRVALAEEVLTMRKLFLNSTCDQSVSGCSRSQFVRCEFSEQPSFPTILDRPNFRTSTDAVCNDEQQCSGEAGIRKRTYRLSVSYNHRAKISLHLGARCSSDLRRVSAFEQTHSFAEHETPRISGVAFYFYRSRRCVT